MKYLIAIMMLVGVTLPALSQGYQDPRNLYSPYGGYATRQWNGQYPNYNYGGGYEYGPPGQYGPSYVPQSGYHWYHTQRNWGLYYPQRRCGWYAC